MLPVYLIFSRRSQRLPPPRHLYAMGEMFTSKNTHFCLRKQDRDPAADSGALVGEAEADRHIQGEGSCAMIASVRCVPCVP